MSANEGITHASVREFLVKNNGKVKNLDLVHHFRQQLNDPVNKSELCVLLFSISRKRNPILKYILLNDLLLFLGKVRGEFKEIVHTIATVQTIDVSTLRC